MTKERYIPVKDHKEFYRDSQTNAIVSGDSDARQLYRNKMKLKAQNELKEARRESEINTLKKEVSEIKDVLKLILEKVSNGSN